MSFKNSKKLTDAEKDIVISYARENGIWSVKEKFNIWPETVRYWMNPALRNKIKNTVRKKKTPEQKERDKVYRELRKKNGISTTYWKEWYSKLSDEERNNHKAKIQKHRLDNLEHYREKAKNNNIRYRATLRQRYSEDSLFKLKCNIREHIRKALKYSNISKTHPSIIYLGCSLEEFREHIEVQFVDGMSWENHGRGEKYWHLDHIKPLAMLSDINNIDILKEICNYKNYQPLWEKDNLAKQDKYEQ